MYKEKLKDERFLKIYFIDGELIVDVNSDWETILNQREKITRIETNEWVWDLLTGEVVFH
jgi:hypothetical protein